MHVFKNASNELSEVHNDLSELHFLDMSLTGLDQTATLLYHPKENIFCYFIKEALGVWLVR